VRNRTGAATVVVSIMAVVGLGALATALLLPGSPLRPGASMSPPVALSSSPTPGATFTPTPGATPAPTPGATPGATPSPTHEAFAAPSIPWPLVNLDPGIASRGAHPTLSQLSGYLYGNKALLSVQSGVPLTDWRLSRPSMSAVSGYADAVSVTPGESIGLHLAGAYRTARIDVFRLGAGDAQHLLTVPQVPVAPMVVPHPDATTGLDAMGWPLSYRLAVPPDWRSGVYLAKLSASGGQSYLLFVVRPLKPTALTVMVPMLTFEAYNSWNGISLYGWEPTSGNHPVRGYKVSLDRPFGAENGAALLFRTAFPLIVWLEDHGYSPGYITDADLAADPAWATGSRTVVIAGHSEYWTASMRDALLAAEDRGVGVAAFGGNLIYRQIRLEPDSRGAPDRTVVCYKEAALDPLARTQPELATIEFAKLPVPEPASQVLGADWAGITLQTRPLIVGNAIRTFAPDIGLKAGQALPALMGGEVDQLTDTARGIALTQTPLVNTAGQQISPTASLWISPGGAHVFEAGTFAWTWGLDPRYAAALPGFPADPFAHLTAEILAWAGAFPAGG